MIRSRLVRRSVLAGVLAVLVLPPSVSAGQEAGSVAPARVRIVDFAFRPATVNITVGTAVGWRNFGSAPHTSTSDTGVWDSGVLTTGDVFGRRFQSPGVFQYHCSIHPFMTGQVVVSSG